MKGDGWKVLLILAVIALSLYIDYCVAVSDLPDWFKFSILSR
jgi:hypothetical protein